MHKYHKHNFLIGESYTCP